LTDYFHGVLVHALHLTSPGFEQYCVLIGQCIDFADKNQTSPAVLVVCESPVHVPMPLFF